MYEDQTGNCHSGKKRSLRHALTLHCTFLLTLFLAAGCGTVTPTGTGKAEPTTPVSPIVSPSVAATPGPLPEYPGALLVSSKGGVSEVLLDKTYTTPDSVDAVLEFYRSRLPQYGWRYAPEIRADPGVLVYMYTSSSQAAKQYQLLISARRWTGETRIFVAMHTVPSFLLTPETPVPDPTVPTYPGAKVVSSEGLNPQSTVYTTADEPEQVIEYYRTELVKLGWRQASVQGPLFASYYYVIPLPAGDLRSPEEYDLKVSAHKDGDLTSFQVLLSHLFPR